MPLLGDMGLLVAVLSLMVAVLSALGYLWSCLEVTRRAFSCKAMLRE